MNKPTLLALTLLTALGIGSAAAAPAHAPSLAGGAPTLEVAKKKAAQAKPGTPKKGKKAKARKR